MNVTHILKLKGSSTVETISPETSVAAASAILAEKRFGALVVSVSGKDIAGIISERDIVRALAREAGGCVGIGRGRTSCPARRRRASGRGVSFERAPSRACLDRHASPVA